MRKYGGPILFGLLFASLYLLAVLVAPITEPIYRYEGLHATETNGRERYAWSTPRSELYIIPQYTTPYLIMHQVLLAGPHVNDTRTVSISTPSAASPIQFAIAGGAPRRNYVYLLPIVHPKPHATFTIADIPRTNRSDTLLDREPRKLGFIVYHTSIGYGMHASIPGLSILAFVCIPLVSILVIYALNPSNIQLAYTVATIGLLMLLGVYVLRPAELMIAVFGVFSVLAVLPFMLYLLRMALIVGDWNDTQLSIMSALTVAIPIFFLVAGARANLGQYWLNQPLLFWAILCIPLIACGVAVFKPGQSQLQLALGIVCVLIVGYWGLMRMRFELYEDTPDFQAYYNAITRFNHAIPIYTDGYHREKLVNATFAPFLYKYPLFFLFIMIPFANMPFDTAIMIWRLISGVCIVASLVLILHATRTLKNPLVVVGSVIIGLNLAPIHQSLRFGQVDALFLLGIVGATAVMYTRQQWLSVPLWSMLGIIKIYPLFLVLPELLRRNWKYLASVSVMIVGCWLGAAFYFGLANEQDFWRYMAPVLGDRTARLSNQSIYGMLARLIDPTLVHAGNAAVVTPLANLVHIVLALAVITSSALVVYASLGRVAMVKWDIVSLLTCVMLLVAPLSWDHYQTLLLLPLLTGYARIQRQRSWSSRLLFLCAYALLAFGSYKNLAVGLLDSTVVIFAASYRVWGAMLLWQWWYCELSSVTRQQPTHGTARQILGRLFRQA